MNYRIYSIKRRPRLNAVDGSKITSKRRPRINAAPNQKNARLFEDYTQKKFTSMVQLGNLHHLGNLFSCVTMFLSSQQKSETLEL